jgi:phosphatidylglycerol:prolipoprotein diacylglycerol transferase
MPDFYTTIGPLRLQTFTLVVGLAIIAALSLGVYRLRDRRGAVVDAGLAALVGGVIGARALHVLLHWSYFAYHTDEILWVRAGGLSWHGALIGGLIGLRLAARWRRLGFSALLAAFTPALPLLALAGWWGCAAANCGFGAEVDTLANYPPLLVAERPDVYGIPAPRYNTVLFGLVLGAAVGGLMVWFLARRKLAARHFGLALALLSAGMFVIGFARADYAVQIAGLRADQWLDLGALLLGLVLFSRLPDSVGVRSNISDQQSE